MRKVHGQVAFGGTVGYCPQTAWIQNTTLVGSLYLAFEKFHQLTGSQRENITFGHDFDEDRYWRAVKDASLLPDLLVLPDGDLTEVFI
jgi:ABC-type multidrug transport system fused ATPase/permease subunit